jgi:hypothetical protein
MGEKTEISWAKPGPDPMPPREGDKKQARQRVNVEVRTGYRPHPNTMPCTDCGHIWEPGERRHEYDHHLGYAAQHHYDVQPVCTDCHARRDSLKVAQTSCVNGHKFTPENTGIRPNGNRFCRECRRIFDRERRTRPPGYWKELNRRRRNG